jgi:hypothetical protein
MTNITFNMELNYKKLPNNANDDKENEYLLSQYKEEGSNYDIEENNTVKPLKIPGFIKEENNCCNNLIEFLFCKSKTQKINQKELKAYYMLKEIALISYDQNNSDHENTLKNLFKISLNCELTENLETVEWKSLGFQVIIIIKIKEN